MIIPVFKVTEHLTATQLKPPEYVGYPNKKNEHVPKIHHT